MLGFLSCPLRGAGWGFGSPFTVSTSDRACRRWFGVGVWVWLGGTHIAAGPDVKKRFGTLLGPEETPVVVLFSGPPLCVVSNAVRHLVGFVPGWVCGCGGAGGFGVWLCVECCIVDASILLWSSV